MGLKEFVADYGGFEFPLPDIAGHYAGKSCAVVGDAACVWTDLEQLGCRDDTGPGNRGAVRREGFDFLCVNKIGEVFPGTIEHWYSNQPDILHKYIAARRPEYGREFAGPKHTHSCNRGAKWRWPFGGHGTSGLGAVLTALGLGYDRVYVCGIPLDNSPHNGEPPWRRCRFETSEAAGNVNTGINMHWGRAIENAFDGKVFAMSGRLASWLGKPQKSMGGLKRGVSRIL